MEITLGEATKLLHNIMVNYSQWHTERFTSKKVPAIEEINVLSGKMDELMKLFANKSAPTDPNDMRLSTLITRIRPRIEISSIRVVTKIVPTNKIHTHRFIVILNQSRQGHIIRIRRNTLISK